MTRTEFQKALRDLKQYRLQDNLVRSERGLFPQSQQQSIRDKQITRLLKSFVDSYDDKRQFRRETKWGILFFAAFWMSLLLLACILFSKSVLADPDRSIADVAALLAALVPLVTAMLGTLGVVVRYVFPEDEDKNTAEILRLVQESDLKNRQLDLADIYDAPSVQTSPSEGGEVKKEVVKSEADLL